jgi:hypothetical protein
MTKPVIHHTWKQANEMQQEREQKQAEKVKGGINFNMTNGWKKLWDLSIEKYWVPWRKRKNP